MNFFNTIKLLAEKEIYDELDAILSTLICFNVLNAELLTPAGQLACEGKKDTALKLLELGKYEVHPNHLARGAAQGGHYDFAMQLVKEHGADINEVGHGAGYRGDKDYAKTLMQDYEVDPTAIAQGVALAKGAHFEFIFELLDEHKAKADKIAYYVGYSGDQFLASRLIENYQVSPGQIALGAAAGGHTTFALNFLLDGAVNPSLLATAAAEGGKFEFARDIGRARPNAFPTGLGMGGFRHKADEFLSQSIDRHLLEDITWIAAGAARRGHEQFVYDLLEKFKRNYRLFNSAMLRHLDLGRIVFMAAVGGHVQLAINLFHKLPKSGSHLIRGLVEAKLLENEEQLWKFFKLITDQKTLTALSNAIAEEESVPLEVKIARANITLNFTKILEYCQHYSINFQQAECLMRRPESLTWLLRCYGALMDSFHNSKNIQLPPEMLLVITSFLIPLQPDQVADLRFRLTKKELEKEIISYVQPQGDRSNVLSTLFTALTKSSAAQPRHSEAAVQFKERVTGIQNFADLKRETKEHYNFITAQTSQPSSSTADTSQDSYTSLLAKYCNAMGELPCIRPK